VRESENNRSYLNRSIQFRASRFDANDASFRGNIHFFKRRGFSLEGSAFRRKARGSIRHITSPPGEEPERDWSRIPGFTPRTTELGRSGERRLVQGVCVGVER
jgi:hypothetical protein